MVFSGGGGREKPASETPSRAADRRAESTLAACLLRAGAGQRLRKRLGFAGTWGAARPSRAEGVLETAHPCCQSLATSLGTGHPGLETQSADRGQGRLPLSLPSSVGLLRT